MSDMLFPAPQAPPQDAAPPDAAGPAGNPEELLTTMLELATAYASTETDHGDMLKIERARTLIQQILADHQSQHQQLMGGGNQRALARLGY